MGMLRARGKNLLFADADGATTFSELLKMEKELGKVERNGQGLVCGSRAHLQVSIAYHVFNFQLKFKDATRMTTSTEVLLKTLRSFYILNPPSDTRHNQK